MNVPLAREAITTAITTATWTAALLMVPLVAMLVTKEVNWGIGDFLAAGALLFSAGMVYMLASRRTRSPRQKVVVGLVVLLVLATIWAELAVGLFS